jgi:hypothetical protein
LIIDNGKLDEDGDPEGPFTLRFSDHAQPFSRDNGEDITYMRNGKVYSAGYTIEAVIDYNYEIDLSDVWQFLEQNAPDNGNVRFSVAPQVDTPEFKNWFGDSKVVDENGKPLVVYHGSGTTFWEFKTEFTGLGKNMYKKRKSTANLFAKLRKKFESCGT